MKVVSQTSVPAFELKAALKKIKKRDKELGFRAQKTVDYLDQFVKLDEKKGKELIEKLLALNISRLRDQHFHKIADIMPSTAKDVKITLQGYNVTVSQENCKKIADVVSEFL